MITELDISVLPWRSPTVIADIAHREEGDETLNPYTEGLPDEIQEQLARRYAELFEVYLKFRDVVERVTFWGVTDGDSWLNNFPVRGRTNHPLLFDRSGRPKPAYYAVLETARHAGGSGREAARVFQNPILPGFHADPSICRVGDDYYLVTSSFEYFPAIPIFHSRDLVHWRQIGHVLDRPGQVDLANVPSSGGLFAPTIRHHDGRFYVICTVVWGGGNFYVTAEDPAGPWSDPVWLEPDGIDPSLAFDADGTVYYHRQLDGARGFIGQRVLNLETGRPEGEVVELWRGTGGVWPEGPHLYRVGGYWYLLISEGGTSYGHRVTVARSTSPWGPFESNPANPILTHRHLPDHPFQALGHADLVETPAGWWMVFLGFRPQAGRHHHIGRETFLAPVTWSDDGWPVVNENEPIPETLPAPDLPAHPWPEPPVRLRFDGGALPLGWQHVRNPVRENYSLSERPGWLRLKGAAATLADRASPTFLGRRQTGLGCRASVKLDFAPAAPNEEAGLALRGHESDHTLFGIGLEDGRRHVFLRLVRNGEVAEVRSPEPLPPGEVILTIEATPATYVFSYQAAGGEVRRLGEHPTRDLSSETLSQGRGMSFTGVYFGLYATGNGTPAEAPADFAWFEYEVTER
ncbi:MAG: glycoside hydrolase family 43 protein [Puniceicoccaceae bacterium]|nr:MAG: glycoside hydrolase family 43 protein [Puniceicoccaceae bacterium]